MEESLTNHSVAISRIEDCEDDMKICKEDVDQTKIQISSVKRDIRMLEASMGSAHEQLEDLGDRMDRCFAKTWQVCSLNETNSWVLGLEIQKVQRESRKEVEGLFSKFEWVNQIFNKKAVCMEEELDRIVALVGEKIDAKIGEITSDWVEALEIKENQRKDLKGKITFLEEKIVNCLTHQADMVALVLSLQGRISEVEDAIMEEPEEDDAEVLSSSSSDLDPVENMIVIPILALSIIHMLVEVSEEFIPPILHSSSSVTSTLSPEYVQALEEDLSHAGVPK